MTTAKALNPDDCVLVDALASTDALWAPFRDYRTAGPHAVGTLWTRRRDFGESGVEVFSGLNAVAERMSFSRRLARLAETGRLIACKTWGRTCGIRLTDSGDEAARSLAALPLLAEALDVMGTLPSGCQWARETALIGVTDYLPGDRAQKLALVELRLALAPGLWRRWVEGWADLSRRTCYRLTPAGTEALTCGDVMPAMKLPRLKMAAAERYRDVFRRELQARINWSDPGSESETGDAPLSASMPTMPPTV